MSTAAMASTSLVYAFDDSYDMDFGFPPPAFHTYTRLQTMRSMDNTALLPTPSTEPPDHPPVGVESSGKSDSEVSSDLDASSSSA